VSQANPHQTVQTFIDLVARHEQAFYGFVHKVHSKGEGLFDSLMKWIELFIGLMREGFGQPLSLEFILPHAGGEERADIIREVDAVALYHYKLKLAHEDKIRKRFGRSANANASVEDQEEAAAQEFMADIVRDMQFSDVVRGEAGDLGVQSESGSEFDTDETDETDSSGEDSESSSGTGTAESGGNTVPPNTAPLLERQPSTSAKGRSSLDVPPRAKSGALRQARSFSHDIPSSAKKDNTGGRKPLRSSPTPAPRRRKAPANTLKEPELKLLPGLLPLFVELVSPILTPVEQSPDRSAVGSTHAPTSYCLNTNFMTASDICPLLWIYFTSMPLIRLVCGLTLCMFLSVDCSHTVPLHLTKHKQTVVQGSQLTS
jgi:hypothetical protein